jgi:hypothetical protein
MTSPVTPASVQIPKEPEAAVVADFPIHALRVAYIAKPYVTKLGADWHVPGVYLLIGPGLIAGRLPVYVGKSVGMRGRLITHRSKPKLDWARAMLVRRDTTDGFNSAEVGYLEGRVAGELAGLPGIDLHLEKEDLDTTLPGHLLPVLDAFVPTILAAARLGGLSLVPAPDDVVDEDAAGNGGGRKTYSGTVADLLAAGLLEAGAQLTFSRAGKVAQGKVTSEGEIVVEGKAYGSPSTAAAKALGLKAANGWVSWRLDGGTGATLAELRAQLPQPEATQQ